MREDDGMTGHEPGGMDSEFRSRLRAALGSEVRRDAGARPAQRILRVVPRGAAVLITAAVLVGVGMQLRSDQQEAVLESQPDVTVSASASSAMVEVRCLPPSAGPIDDTASLGEMTVEAYVPVTGRVVDGEEIRAACERVVADSQTDSGPPSRGEPLDDAAVGELQVEFQSGRTAGDLGICMTDESLLVVPAGVSCARFGLEPAPSESEDGAQ